MSPSFKTKPLENSVSTQAPSEREMERVVLARDASYVGIFVFGVTTTGVFCRPGCPARTPRTENLRYFATTKSALFAGFRPCKRCRPMETAGTLPDWVRELMERIEREPDVRISARHLISMGIDPARARRWFQQRHGLTFAAYARSRRLGRALTSIRTGGSIDGAALEHGFESHSGFRSAFTKTFGATPGRAQGTPCVVTTMIESPLGPFVAGATEEGVCLLEFTDRRMLETQFAVLERRFGCKPIPGRNTHLDALRVELDAYFQGRLRTFEVPIVYPGTLFEVEVWSELLRIPYGETIAYLDLARRVRRPGASRAVGTANGRNRIAIVIPCHRVVNKNGELGGYGGGVWRKQRMLELELAALGSSRPLNLF